MTIIRNEYRYTIDGWFTETALVEGYVETAKRQDLELRMTVSLKNAYFVNFYFITLFKGDDVIESKRVRELKPARKVFTAYCMKYRLNHERYNPQ